MFPFVWLHIVLNIGFQKQMSSEQCISAKQALSTLKQ